jgi:hypothetical protein
MAQPVWCSIHRLTARAADDREVGFDRILGAVVDGPGLQIVLGRRE